MSAAKINLLTSAGVTGAKQNSFACTQNEEITVKKVVDTINPAVMAFGDDDDARFTKFY